MERILENKAGKWVYLPEKYAAFIPKELSLVKNLELSKEVYLALEKTKEEVFKFNKKNFFNNPNEKTTELFLKFFLLKEAIYSSKIEGIETSKEDLLQADRANNLSDFLSDDVYNNYIAIKYAFDMSEKLPLSKRFFRNTQKTLLRNPDKEYCTPGEFRTTQNWIGRGDSAIENALYVPPPAKELSRLLANLENYINDTEGEKELLIKAAIIHSQFESIHPFLDGNGRTGRIINSIFLKNNNLCDSRYLIFSEAIYKNLNGYYENLQGVHNYGDWEAWILFYLKMVREAVKNSEDLLFCLRNSYELNEIKLNRLIEESSVRDSIIMFKDFVGNIALEYGSISSKNLHMKYLLSKLQEFGIIGKIGKNVYKYSEIFNLL